MHLYLSGSCRELLGLQPHLVFPDSVLREIAVYTEGRSWNWFHVLEMYTNNQYFIRCYYKMPALVYKYTYNAEVVVQILIAHLASSEYGTNTEEQSSWNMSCLGFQGQRQFDSESWSLPCSSRCTNCTNFPRKGTRGTIIGAARWGEIPCKLQLTPTRGNVPVANLHRNTKLAPGIYYRACA